MKQYIFYAMGFYVFYIFALLLLNFRVRLKAIRQKEIRLSFFKAYVNLPDTPEYIIVWGRHIDNQFQLPLLFFITCLALMSTIKIGLLTVSLAWLFVFSRLLHSVVHLSSRNVRLRAMVYGTGWIFILLMWVQILIHEF